METQYYQQLSAWCAANLEPGMFYLLAFLAIPLAYGVIFDPRIIRCGFLLIGVFSAISGIFMLLGAQFLALAQIMIYAVGITLVVVIALMLTNPKMELDTAPALAEHKGPSIFVAALVFITIYFGLRSESWQSHGTAPVPPEANIEQIGINLLGYYSIPFEFASILLLIALIGAVMLAKADKPTRAEEWIEDDEEAIMDRSEDNVIKV